MASAHALRQEVVPEEPQVFLPIAMPQTPLPAAAFSEEDPRVLQTQYSFHAALFSRAFPFFLRSGIFSPELIAYICLLTAAAVLGGLAVCQPGSGSSSSILLGPGGGCWSASYAFSWSDMTLSTLTSFLLSLLVNNVLTRWWTARTMVQDCTNTVIQILFNLAFAQEPRPHGLGEEEWLARGEAFSAVKRRVKRRLFLAFELMLITASTQDLKDSFSCHTMTEAYAELRAAPADGSKGPVLGHGAPLITQAEWEVLGHHRFAVAPLAWCVRDMQGLLDREVINALRFNELLALCVKLRATLNDIPFYVRVQLPFVAVSMVACVVHLTLLQLVYTSASYIGLGLAEPGQGARAWAGLLSIVLVSTIFLSILKLQAEMSNPFRVFSTRSVSAPLASSCALPARLAPLT